MRIEVRAVSRWGAGRAGEGGGACRGITPL